MDSIVALGLEPNCTLTIRIPAALAAFAVALGFGAPRSAPPEGMAIYTGCAPAI
jgi:hypothetical protein